VFAARYGMAGSVFDHKAARLHKCGLLGAILAAWLKSCPQRHELGVSSGKAIYTALFLETLEDYKLYTGFKAKNLNYIELARRLFALHV